MLYSFRGGRGPNRSAGNTKRKCWEREQRSEPGVDPGTQGERGGVD